MTVLFILFIWMGEDPRPVGAYASEDECWKRAVELKAVADSADCRVFTSPSLVGKRFTYAPLTSPRPKPRPANLTGSE